MFGGAWIIFEAARRYLAQVHCAYRTVLVVINSEDGGDSLG